MNSQNKVRPEDLRPARQQEHPHAYEPSPSSSPPDPHDVAAMEEAMVPALSLASYLALGTSLLATLPRLRSTRFFSEFLSLAIFAVPFLIAGYASGNFSSADNHLLNQLAETTVDNPPPSSTIVMFAVLGTIVGIIMLLVLKSILDAQAYSVLRQALSGHDSSKRPGLKKTAAFFGANLFQLGLATGAGLGMSPVILRLARRVFITQDVSIALGFVLPLLIGMSLYGWIRVLSMYVSGWITWRPSFIAGALGSAIASPIRAFRNFWGSYFILFVVLSAGIVIVTVSATGLYLPGIEVQLPHLVLQFCMIGALITMVQALVWFDTSIVASIGHRVGEFVVASSHEEAVRLRNIALRANLQSTDQEVITAAPPGAFRSTSRASTRVTFAHVLALTEPPNTTAPQPAPSTLIDAAHTPSSPHTQARTSTENLASPTSDEAESPWIAPPTDDNDSGARGFARLEPSLLPVKMRTRNNQPERRYKGYRHR